MKTFYLQYSITVAIQAEDAQDAAQKSEEMTDKEIFLNGEFGTDAIIYDEDFEEVGNEPTDTGSEQQEIDSGSLESSEDD